ncbi:large conductance mechanosensitive channel protein MscL [Bacillus sp. NPDC094077]|uniref:large conductance mechanosensitive channel protein MscL n=1 Tax=Bacillus sp. NPDC094077 TaxID=3390932 RepID=UPI003D01744D
MWNEFKKFALKGNVIDLAVGVVIGGAFGKIVSSLVGDVIMPLIGLLLGGVNFKGLSFTFGGAVVKYGAFIQTVVDFLIIAFSIFLFIKLFNKLTLKKEETEEEELPEPTKEEELLSEIRDLLKQQNSSKDRA